MAGLTILSTTITDVSDWLDQIARLPKEQKCTAPHFLRPAHFVALALSLKRLNVTGFQFPERLERYAARMKIWEAVGVDPNVKVNAQAPDGNFLPMETLADANCVLNSAAKLAEIASTHGADDETVNSLEITLAEIMGNCFAHADADANDNLHGVACAQAWPNGAKAQIAIADAGTGIRRTLSENAALNDRLQIENCCRMATEYGVTGKPGAGHAGYGLTLARDLIVQNRGTLLVVSEDEFFSASNGNIRTGVMKRPWHGTLVVIEWNLDRPLRVKDVYDAWPLPEGFADDDLGI